MKAKRILVSIVVTLIMLLCLTPMSVLAAEEGTAGGSFTLGNTDPTVDAVGIYETDHTTPVTSMTPQNEYAIKVTVSDSNQLSDLDTVVVTIFYDSDGDNDSADVPSTGDTQNAAILTCTVGATPSWNIDPSTSTTWALINGSCVQPTLSLSSGDWWFHFKPGKVATEATDWDAYAVADDGNGGTPGALYDSSGYDMNWFSEITVTTGSIDFGGIALGATDNVSPSVDLTYIANGNYSEQIKTDDGEVTPAAQWKGNTSPNVVTLEEIEATPGYGEFVLKADDDNTIADAVQVKSTYVDIATDGVQTGESGATTSDNTLWISLCSEGIAADTYNGTIYFQIITR